MRVLVEFTTDTQLTATIIIIDTQYLSAHWKQKSVYSMGLFWYSGF